MIDYHSYLQCFREVQITVILVLSFPSILVWRHLIFRVSARGWKPASFGCRLALDSLLTFQPFADLSLWRRIVCRQGIGCETHTAFPMELHASLEACELTQAIDPSQRCRQHRVLAGKCRDKSISAKQSVVLSTCSH